jgi:hypothetical protein
MSIARKIFIGRVTLPALTATSLYQLMRDSSLHWGFETTALATPSLDSIIGSECGVTPDAPVYVGSDSNTNSSTGIALTPTQNFSLQDFGSDFGVIDPNQIYFWNQNGCGMAVTFQAR